MAGEARRGCGFRKHGGMYLVGEYVFVPCDRLPYPLDVCPTCGAGIKVGRGMTKIIPKTLFGNHGNCTEERHNCVMCHPKDDVAYIMRVGEKFYPEPEDFIKEGIAMGFSKRIAQIPKDFEIGKTVIYLAHINACKVKEPVAVQEAMNILMESQIHLIDVPKEKRTTGIFTAFIPQRIEKMYWQKEIDEMSEEELKSLQKRGITPVGLPDLDKDHFS